MLVYHFVPLNHALSNIAKRQLKISQLHNLNDPFDFVAPACPDPLLRQALRANLSSHQERVGLLCFSRDWHNPVQWTHYADSHKGACLELEVSSDAVMPVRYVAERPILNYTYDEIEKATQMLVDASLLKFEHWRYEDEVRAVVDLTRSEVRSEGGLFFAPFDESLRLKRVILGARCPLGRAAFEQKAGSKALTDVSLIKARPAFNTFRIVEQHDQTLWA